MMKFFYFLIIALFLSCDPDDGHNNEIPSLVLNAFHSKFPHAQDVEWERHKKGFRVEFEVEGKEKRAFLDLKGTVLQSYK